MWPASVKSSHPPTRATGLPSGFAAMKKTASEWKTRDYKAATNHFQNAFIEKKAPPASLPFSFPHLRSLRNQSTYLSAYLKYICDICFVGGAYSSIECYCDYIADVWDSPTNFTKSSRDTKDLSCDTASSRTTSDSSGADEKSGENHNSEKVEPQSTRETASSTLATITW